MKNKSPNNAPMNTLLRFGVAVLATVQVHAQPSSGLSDYQQLPFTINNVASRIVPVDLDGDGLMDILTADEELLSVYFQRGDEGKAAFDFSNPNAALELPGSSTGWAIDQLPGQSDSEAKRLVALVDGGQVLAWSFADRDFSEPTSVLESLSGFLPGGVYPMDFVRDLNGDGLKDLIIPGVGELQLHLQSTAGGYGEALRVKSRISNSARLSAEEFLTSQVGQSVRVPQLNIRDVNDDQHKDLVASSEERLEVFLADSKGRFPSSASYSVDLRELRERVGEVDFDDVDYSNLSGMLAHTYDIQLEDVDGDKIEDLLIREGGKLTLFGGTPDGMDMEKPRQILKSSGNVLAAILLDEDEDGLKDLWLMRIENVSLGNLFLWLAVSGSIDVESFVYKNQGQRFASRPHRKVTLSVKFPSILRSVDMVTAATEPQEDVKVVRSVRAQLDDENSDLDLAVLQQKALAIFLNTIKGEQSENFLGLSDYSRDKDQYVYDLAKVLENPAMGGNDDLEVVSSRQSDFELSLASEDFSLDLGRADVQAWDMNKDGRDDFFVLSERDENSVSGLLLLSQ